jgi:hypothetical protein
MGNKKTLNIRNKLVEITKYSASLTVILFWRHKPQKSSHSSTQPKPSNTEKDKLQEPATNGAQVRHVWR